MGAKRHTEDHAIWRAATNKAAKCRTPRSSSSADALLAVHIKSISWRRKCRLCCCDDAESHTCYWWHYIIADRCNANLLIAQTSHQTFATDDESRNVIPDGF